MRLKGSYKYEIKPSNYSVLCQGYLHVIQINYNRYDIYNSPLVAIVITRRATIEILINLMMTSIQPAN